MIFKEIQKLYPDLIIPKGMEDALVGVAHRFGGDTFAVLDSSKIGKEKITNLLSQWAGEKTPAFLVEKIN